MIIKLMDILMSVIQVGFLMILHVKLVVMPFLIAYCVTMHMNALNVKVLSILFSKFIQLTMKKTISKLKLKLK